MKLTLTLHNSNTAWKELRVSAAKRRALEVDEARKNESTRQLAKQKHEEGKAKLKDDMRKR